MMKLLSHMWVKRLVVLMSLLCFTGVTAPAPAYAAIGVADSANTSMAAQIYAAIKEWGAKIISAISSVLSLVTNFANALFDWFNEFFDIKLIVTAIQLMADHLMMELDLRLAQAKVDANTVATYIDLLVSNYTDKSMEESEAVAEALLISQGPAMTDSFRGSVQALVLSSIDSSYRGKGKDGNGPARAADDYEERCSSGLAGDDYPDECEKSSLTGDIGQPYTDSDLTITTLSGGQVLELPEFENYTDDNGVTYNVPDPQNTEQKFWVAATKFCDNFVGPAPTPPSNKELDTAQGRTKAVKWNTCASRRSGFAQACALLVSDNTRPNSSFTEMISQQKTRCTAAEDLGISIPDSFDDCEKGLSPSQERFLTKMLCMSPEFYKRRAAMLETYPEMKDVTIDCMRLFDLDMQMEATMHRAVTVAADGVLDLKACWAEVDAIK